ncbi:hypothetical protein [Burkholderia gladioli]|uniref:hypothetical protein n=1 Tax=Burkholderia gladioli TaxID=28095 RepID=UPI00163F7396|nr:hypothetical protein [Burkholderia gladioli]
MKISDIDLPMAASDLQVGVRLVCPDGEAHRIEWISNLPDWTMLRVVNNATVHRYAPDDLVTVRTAY